MAWNQTYNNTLTTNDGLGGSNYNYVVRLPAGTISGGAAYTRLSLRGPTSGQSRIQKFYIGHAAPNGELYSFDGNQVQLKVNDAVAFTIGDALVVTDPVAFVIDSTKPLLIAYELLANDTYRSASGLASGYAHYWKTGTGDAANTTKSGYSGLTSRTALLEKIEINTELEQQPSPPTSSQFKTGIEAVLAGQMISAGGVIPAVIDQLAHIMLMNPVTNGKRALLNQIMITSDIDQTATIRSYNSQFANLLPRCNLYFGAGNIGCTVGYGYSPTLLGEIHSIIKLKAGVQKDIIAPWPLVACNPGLGVLIALHAPGGAVCNFEWQEVT